MESRKKYYKLLDVMRIFSCIAVLLYHLNILNGGYLAVCVFFVLSGYLSTISAFKKEHFSFMDYYLNRILKIYLPLIIVVFITIGLLSFFPNINWFNLKPETTSVLLGYNNFWQLSANLDYFTRHINSPFMHFWYIAILLQFDLVFPFIYLFLRNIGDKISKTIPCIITALLSIVGVIYFYKSGLSCDLMVVYYNTFMRIFSLLCGVFLGFIHSYYKVLVPRFLSGKFISKVVVGFYLLVLGLAFIFIGADSKYFAVAMIGVTLISCRLIDYGVMFGDSKPCFGDSFWKSLASVSYEVYLVQYPVIFFFQGLGNQYLRVTLIITLTVVLSYLLHFLLSVGAKRNWIRILKCVGLIFIFVISLYGFYQYFVSEDHSEEMKALEEQMVENQSLMEKKQEEYASRIKKEQVTWSEKLKSLEDGENELGAVVSNLSIVGVGDSVMLGALGNLYQQFPNGYFDAKVSRTAWVVNGILKNLKANNMLGEVILLNVGTNGDCPLSCKREIMDTCKDKEVFWVNVTNDADVHVNSKLASLSSQYSNLHIIDWNTLSRGHSEYFVADGIHLTGVGRKAYTQEIYNSIYQFYLEKYNMEKEAVLKEHDAFLKEKISFYGNDLLLNAYNYVQKDFPDAQFILNKEFDYQSLKEKIETAKSSGTLTHRLVFVFDASVSLKTEEYEELIELCSEHEIYFLTSNENDSKILKNINYENVTVLDFYEALEKNHLYLVADGIHLSDEGNKALARLLGSINGKEEG